MSETRATKILHILSLSFIISALVGWLPSRSRLWITFIDVGQGDAVLIRDSSNFDVLIDGGYKRNGPTIIQYLKNKDARELEIMIATHADLDHIGGLIKVLESKDISVGNVLYGYRGKTKTWSEFETAAMAKSQKLSNLYYPNEVTWGSYTAKILNPSEGLSNPETNAASVVILIDHGDVELLLTGDIDSEIEQEIITRGSSVSADILKVAHHGSRNGTSELFLASVQPTVAIISSGEGNRHRHPHSELLERLERQNVTICRTDTSGSIEIVSDGKAFALVHPQSGDLIMDLSDYCASVSSENPPESMDQGQTLSSILQEVNDVESWWPDRKAGEGTIR